MKSMLLIVMGLAIGPVSAENVALQELRSFAGVSADTLKVPAAAATKAPGRDQRVINPTILCAMSANYRETIHRLPLLPFIQIIKNIEGTATVTCPGQDPVQLKVTGGGLAPGVGLPVGDGSRSVVGLHVQVPVPFVPQDLEGEYLRLGVDTVLGGAAVSPWINRSNVSANIVLYLPGNFGTLAAIDLSALSFKLAK